MTPRAVFVCSLLVLLGAAFTVGLEVLREAVQRVMEGL